MKSDNFLFQLNNHAIKFSSQQAFFIDTLLKESLKNTFINTIGYMDFYSDNTYIQLSNNVEMLQYCMSEISDNGYFRDVVRKVSPHEPFWFTWSSNQPHEQIKKYASFNISNGVCIYWRTNTSVKSLQFTTPLEVDFSNAVNFYLNNRAQILQITRCIEAKISSFLENFEKIPKGTFPDPTFHTQFDPSDINTEYLKLINNSNLTSREDECLYHLLRGKTAKETARLLNISYRTVEEHVNNLKIKLNCEKKSHIIEESFKSGLITFNSNQVILK